MSHLWIVFVLGGAVGQVARNALQASLTGRLGTLGATLVRFLYGLPFGALFLATAVALLGPPPRPAWSFAGWIGLGSLAQIGGTALMLAVMQARSFVVATAYIKTEPLLVVLFGATMLGDRLSPLALAAVLVATLGVVLLSWPSRRAEARLFAWRPAMLGLGAAALYGLSAVGFRGAILSLGEGSYLLRAPTALLASLLVQTGVLVVYLACTEPDRLRAVFASWRASLPAGFSGAAASQCWFLAFALESAAHVRTLALIEILLAGLVGRRFFQQRLSAREWTGIAAMLAGLAGVVA